MLSSSEKTRPFCKESPGARSEAASAAGRRCTIVRTSFSSDTSECSNCSSPVSNCRNPVEAVTKPSCPNLKPCAVSRRSTRSRSSVMGRCSARGIAIRPLDDDMSVLPSGLVPPPSLTTTGVPLPPAPDKFIMVGKYGERPRRWIGLKFLVMASKALSIWSLGVSWSSGAEVRTRCLQVGQSSWLFNHVWMHSVWKACPHASIPEELPVRSEMLQELSQSLGGMLSSRQMVHVISMVATQSAGSGLSSTGARCGRAGCTCMRPIICVMMLSTSTGRSTKVPREPSSSFV
mmetsp:Transcript_15472/g.24711  ORF Transcript_15472/g.24711 Transcript_15472/m.24711 type:complete len:289 (+) Transcript_15472:58-924(+)